ncbi:sensor histidine kinase [Aestuariicoccus sp. MJ-SS9]|uniref:sensor histidine kinase n=1 Tax=Aestuariicoccus sp. MJ-SS9 TaxID=3079855 RepID=UPI0029106D35|nr:ATP-binding protein [Aestuariicoccus sp. MJ-SS9]MDU8910602.1 ATP-binding protein [Aestuariicoccus sp. MJ-SS9]
MRSKLGIAAIYLAAVAGLTAAVWGYGYGQALDQAAARGRADLALAADRLVTQLQRYRETAVLMSDHPVLSALHGGAPRAAADALLLETADKTAALTAYYADPGGRVLASAHGIAPEGLAEAGYFRRALQGALGAEHGSSAGFSRRAYSFAAPSFGPDGTVLGVLVVVVDIDNLEQDWRGSWPAVYFTDRSGQVFVTNRSEMLFWRRVPGGMETAGGLIGVDRQDVGGHEIWHQALSAYVPQAALHLERDLPVIGMLGEVLVDVAPARRLAGLQAAAMAALCLFFGALLWLATERRRALSAANAVLEDRVQQRTRALESSNAALRREVTERQEAEAALKRAQAELVQAGKLSALGQMSAGISHELNQPLMAIQQYAENGAQFLARGQADRAEGNLTRIAKMAARMARIIRSLRAFARQEAQPMGRVDLGAVIGQAIELTEARLAADGIRLDWVPPDRPVLAYGGEVRLAQVLTNLITNAADAMAESPEKCIRIAVEDGARLAVTVRDTGPGITEPEKIFDPFYSTKSVGSSEGMGLGLSISYGLVQSFGGAIRGANCADGGAVFTVELDPWREEAAA